MKRAPKTPAPGDAPGVPKPPAGTPSPRQHAINQALKKRDRAELWKFSLVGGLGLAGVFAFLHLTAKPPQQASNNPILVTIPTQSITPVEESISAHKAGTATAGTDAIAKQGSGSPETTELPASRPEPEIAPADESKLLAAETPLVLTGLDAGRETAIQRDKDLFARAIQGKAWDAYRTLLAKSITAAIERLPDAQGLNRFSPLWKEETLYQTFLRWQVLGKFTQAEIAATVTDSYSAEMLKWLCTTPAAMEEVLLTIKPQDDAGKVLAFLNNAWPNLKGMQEKYFPLALACAVVFDREVRIPNPVGKGEYGARPVIEPMARMLWFVKNNEKGRLAAPVHRSSARDLIWVVCAPVSESELDWSLDKMHHSRSNWGNAYSEVEYLMERAVDGFDPYKEYSFSEILKEGGICGDQSYFCTNTARAQGIPAMTLGGETDLGGHAWVGLKFESDEWTTGVGRIGGVSIGRTGDPQTGESITEQDIQLWSERAHRSPMITIAVARHLWLAEFFRTTGKDDEAADTVHLANRIGPSFTETWAALYAVLRKQMSLTGDPAVPSNLDEWKDFAKSMRREFKDNPRMAALAADAEMEYIFPYGDANDATRTLMRERRRIERDSGEQKDLIAASLKREADLIAKRGEPEALRDISRLYDSALRKYGGSITGFKMMAEDYFGFLKQDPELARKAARDIELAFKRVVETGTKDWFRANTESTIYKMICGYYRTAGDDSRAVLLEKRYEVLLRRAKRSAL